MVVFARIVLLCMWWCVGVVQLAAEPYGFGVIRTERSGVMAQGYEPLLQYLRQQTGQDFVFVYTDSHGELIDRMEAGELHLAHMGPQPYIHLKERCPKAKAAALFLDAQGRSSYRCSLAVMETSPLTSVAQIQKSRLALTQRYSTCGWLHPAVALQSVGASLQESNYFFAGTHVDAVMRLVLGEADVAAAQSDIVDRYAHMGVRHLLISDPYPNFVLALSGIHLSKPLQQEIETALLKLDPQGALERSTWHPLVRYGAIPVDEAIFEPVRRQMQMAGQLP